MPERTAPPPAEGVTAPGMAPGALTALLVEGGRPWCRAAGAGSLWPRSPQQSTLDTNLLRERFLLSVWLGFCSAAPGVRTHTLSSQCDTTVSCFGPAAPALLRRVACEQAVVLQRFCTYYVLQRLPVALSSRHARIRQLCDRDGCLQHSLLTYQPHQLNGKRCSCSNCTCVCPAYLFCRLSQAQRLFRQGLSWLASGVGLTAFQQLLN